MHCSHENAARLVDHEGNVFTGAFNRGFMTKGVMVYANGDTYDGDFVNNRRHGKGFLTLANNETFEGGFKDNKKHGTV